MKKENFKDYFVLINVNTFEVHLTPFKSTVARIVHISRNTISITSRVVIKDYIIIPVKEE